MSSITLISLVQMELMRMKSRCLPNSPSAEELPIVAHVMVDDLRTRGLADADVDRVRTAFAALVPTLERWPTVRAIIDALPSARPAYRALPSPRKEYSQKFVERIDQIGAALKGTRKRCVMVAGESFGEYQAALAASHQSRTEFEARRLLANGWTSERERKFAGPEPGLIHELERLEATDLESMLEREAIQNEDAP